MPESFLVGGAVRDLQMGREPDDRDYVVVGATSTQMLAAGFTQVGADFPVFLHPETGEEYALARTERATGEGHTAFACETDGVSLVDDLSRRDLTVNAMAMSDDGELVDPFGGQADLEARVLRHVGPAFVEDPLRVLRVARFAARFPDFSVAPDTLTLMADMVKTGALGALIPERVALEMVKALRADAPRRFFSVLRDCGALDVVLPELAALDGVPQPLEHHPEGDTWVHTLLVLDQCAAVTSDPVTRFAALVHDLGKGLTPADELPRHHGHEAAGVPVVEALCRRLRLPNEFRDAGVDASSEHLLVHRLPKLRPGTLLKLLDRLGARQSLGRLERLAVVSEADARGRTGRENRDYPQADLLRRAGQVLRDTPTADVARAAIAAGRRGPAVGEAVRQHQVQALSALR